MKSFKEIKNEILLDTEMDTVTGGKTLPYNVFIDDPGKIHISNHKISGGWLTDEHQDYNNDNQINGNDTYVDIVTHM